MHIIEIHETNWIDRNVIQLHHIIERMISRGHTCEVIDYDMLWPTRTNRKIWQPKQVFTNVNKVIPGVSLRVTRPGSLQIPLFCHAIWAISSMVELRRLIQEKRPDVLLGTSLTNSYFLALLARAIHIPFVYMVYEPYYTMVPQKWIRSIAKAVERLSLRAAERVFVFTPRMKKYAQDMGVSSGRIDVFKSGVGQEIFNAGLSGMNRRVELGFGPEEWVLFFMGWLYDFSGLRQIFQAIANNPAILDGARLLVVGDGDIYAELKTIVEQNGLAPKILMIGKQLYKDIPALLGCANVCLMPSLENDTTRNIVPMKVYEYLAAGKPVIASRLPGMFAEFGFNNGIIYTDTPIEALNMALTLAKSPSLVKQLKVEGRCYAEQNANWDETTDKFEEILVSVKSTKL